MGRNKYQLPGTVRMRTVWLIRDYDRMKENTIRYWTMAVHLRMASHVDPLQEILLNASE